MTDAVPARGGVLVHPAPRSIKPVSARILLFYPQLGLN